MANYILILASLLVIVSCDKLSQKMTASDAPQKIYSIVSGRVENTKLSKLRFLNDYYGDHEVALDPTTGEFNDTIWGQGDYLIQIGRPQEIKFLTVYLPEGKKLEVSYDASKLTADTYLDKDDAIKFSGDAAEYNKYLYRLNKSTGFLKLSLLGDFIVLEENVFIKKMDSITAIVKKFTASSRNYLEGDVNDIEEKRIAIMPLYMKYMYAIYHGVSIGKGDYKPHNEELIKLLNDPSIDLNNFENYKTFGSYRRLLFTIIDREANKNLLNRNSEKQAYFENLKKIISTRITNQYIINDLVYKFFNQAFMYGTANQDSEKAYLDFLDLYKGEKKKEIKKMHEKYTRLFPGHPIPQFTDYKRVDGKKVSLSDLKGKYVYIDVWATWCVPCKKEIPFLKRIEKKYNDKITFLGVSVDYQKDKEKWEEMIAEEKLKGVQLIADKDFNSEFIKNCMIDAIPRFILVDPQGNIVDINAPPPSDPELEEIFNKIR